MTSYRRMQNSINCTEEENIEPERMNDTTECTTSSTTDDVLKVIGVCLTAIIVSFLLVVWLQLIYQEVETEFVTTCMLTISTVLGIISGIVTLICSCRKTAFKCININLRKMSYFLYIKTTVFTVFAVITLMSYIIALLHHVFNDCNNYTREINVGFNVLGCVFTVLQFICSVILVTDISQKGNIEKIALLFLISANIGTFLDTILTESSEIFPEFYEKNAFSCNDSMHYIQNSTESCIKVLDIEHFFKDSNPYLSPVVIEFSLMAISYLFSRHKISNRNEERRNPEMWTMLFSCIHAAVLIFFTFFVVITKSSEEISDSSNVSYKYILYTFIQLYLKLFMFVIIFITFLLIRKIRFNRNDSVRMGNNISSIIFLTSCFGNAVYHSLQVIAFSQIPKKWYVWVALGEGCMGIILTIFQTVILMRLQKLPCTDNSLHINEAQSFHNHSHQICTFLSIVNWGLWFSYSFGEIREPIFTLPIYFFYKRMFWNVLTKLILPLAIFYRVHCAMDFLELRLDKFAYGA
ncbi:proton channel OtopLc-like isoform X4 [Saccostrea cucullata]|uniref:proton channel OtopLc-like isoform X4 n=1 Tax=Saccostrea cuccullata TaxID=36930 RepID=UPI002ED09CB4